MPKKCYLCGEVFNGSTTVQHGEHLIQNSTVEVAGRTAIGIYRSAVRRHRTASTGSKGHSSIRTNVCREVLLALADGSMDRLHQLIFEFAKALAKQVPEVSGRLTER